MDFYNTCCYNSSVMHLMSGILRIRKHVIICHTQTGLLRRRAEVKKILLKYFVSL